MTAQRDTATATAPRRSWIMRALLDNLSLKLIAFLSSIVIYVVLHSGRDSQRTVDVDVIFTLPDAGHVLLTPLPQRVHLTVQGPKALLDELHNTIDAVTVDLSSQPGNIRFDTAPFKLPVGVRIMQTVPRILALRWDVKTTKLVRVETAWNTPPEGLVLKAPPTIEPLEIAVTGPKSAVDIVQKIRTEMLDIAHGKPGQNLDRLTVDLLSDNALLGLQLETERVTARFELVPELRTQTFANVAILVLNGRGVTFRPKSVAVTLTCPPKRLAQLNVDNLIPKIDMNDFEPEFAKKGAEETDLKLKVPGCTDITLSPRKVAVQREKVEPKPKP